ncbi:ATP-grasp domain-containing protein [Paracoccus benzoatiresistens]|uniref:ATP-grasp domain-containing protein n=1 Tax=Paracoccus benzoatiresistens TaxID=2997341 RepID=A0ABT4J1V9_9RHOB|nr:ATP-grasp domain-containing protein [Paracoccus sp. EF6]MCZ0960635.1 ATP-grasp domain-containing protein [Paracoccus sp. EF6]
MSEDAGFPVLLSSAGRRVGLLNCFRQAGDRLDRAVVLHASDLDPDLSSACASADHAHQAPRCDDPRFIDHMLDLARSHGVRLIVPTIDTELGAYADAADRFAAIGTRIHVSGPATVAIVRDKNRTASVLAAAGVPVPVTVTEQDLRRDPGIIDWPVFAKPAGGSASRGLAVFRQPSDLPDSFDEPMIFQTLLEGPEFTVNVFIDRDGTLQTVVPHRRLRIRAGEVEKGQTMRRADLRAIAEKLVAALPDARGSLCFQLIDDPRHGPRVFEINARFGGGYPLADHAGARFAQWLIEEELDLPRSAGDDWRDGVLMLRYDDAVFRG